MDITTFATLAITASVLGYGVGCMPIWTTRQAMLGLAITLPAIIAIGYQPLNVLITVLFLGLGFLTAR